MSRIESRTDSAFSGWSSHRPSCDLLVEPPRSRTASIGPASPTTKDGTHMVSVQPNDKGNLPAINQRL